jgi:hypothetical protein
MRRIATYHACIHARCVAVGAKAHALVIAASTATRCPIPRHGGGNPMHCSRNPLSWMRIHMPSDTSCNTVSSRQHISSKSTLADARGARDGPAPGSSNRHLLVALSGAAGGPAASSHRRLSPRGSLSGALYNSTSHPRGTTSTHTQNKQQQIVSVSLSHIYGLISQKPNINHQNIYKTQHTSVIKNLHRRQYHVRVPPEVHPSIGVSKYDLWHLPPDLCRLHREIMPTFAVENQNCGPLPQSRLSCPRRL